MGPIPFEASSLVLANIPLLDFLNYSLLRISTGYNIHCFVSSSASCFPTHIEFCPFFEGGSLEGYMSSSDSLSVIIQPCLSTVVRQFSGEVEPFQVSNYMPSFSRVSVPLTLADEAVFTLSHFHETYPNMTTVKNSLASFFQVPTEIKLSDDDVLALCYN